MTGPLRGIKIVEIAAIGPAPFAGMMLADHGAEVTRIERPERGGLDALIPVEADILARSRHRIVRVDLKTPEGAETVRALAATADGLIEGFRPGVMERLGLGPEALHAANPRLVYGRMTGWGQTGPYAGKPGHDLNYIALAGALDPIGRAGQPPTPPLNLVADFGGGGMMLAFGMVSAILHARTTGQGQVVDCAMVDGTATLMSLIWSLKSAGLWRGERGTNLFDSGAPCYDTYETADGRHVAIAALEPQFYVNLRSALGLGDDPLFDKQFDQGSWPQQKQRLAAIFATRTRDEWCALLDGADVCFAPVLSMDEAPRHPHLAARGTFIEVDGVVQPAPTPRFSRAVPDRE